MPPVRTSRRRLAYLIASLPVLVVASGLLYMWGMAELEGQERTFWQSVSFAAETLSTTGYGDDGTWYHPAMVIFVVVLQFAGVFLIFLIFPIFLIPFLEERFETRLPVVAEEGLSDHLVIWGYGPAVETLVGQTEEAGLATLVVDGDEATVRRLVERGRRAILARLDDDGLAAARLAEARSLVANSSDDVNATVILAARQAGFEGDILGLVEEPLHRRPLMLAGATGVFTPRHVLGAALAARASERISPGVSGLGRLGKLQVHQVRVQPDSEIAGRTLEEAGIGARTGAVVIGQWVDGRLQVSPVASTRIEPGAILVIAGTEEHVERLEEVCAGAVRLRRTGRFVVGGDGEVGQTVVQLLRDAGEEVVVVDKREREGVDRVGDMLDPSVVEELVTDETQAVILAVDADSATLFATVIVKEAAPDVPVIARVNKAENVDRIHRAGADFALSISQVSGQILARRLLGEEAVSVDEQLKVLKVDADGLAGRRPAELDIRERTGASVVGVERDGELIVDLGGDFRFDAGDAVYVCGPAEVVRRFGDEVARSA
jgi:Trk K+ transport system NAD-binding subunit